MLVLGLPSVISGALTLLLPETSGKELMEVSQEPKMKLDHNGQVRIR